jgi:hypothetical protein
MSSPTVAVNQLTGLSRSIETLSTRDTSPFVIVASAGSGRLGGPSTASACASKENEVSTVSSPATTVDEDCGMAVFVWTS